MCPSEECAANQTGLLINYPGIGRNIAILGFQCGENAHEIGLSA